jgi:hypothetical protein
MKEAEFKEAEHKYSSEIFETAEEYFDKLLQKMLPAIKNHEYSVIVGDDASGRIPTLVLRKFIAESYKRDGVEPPETFFYAAGLRNDEKLTLEVYEKIYNDFKKKAKKDGKALIVTEYIFKGRSIGGLVDAVKKAGMDCDVAALTIHNEGIYKRGQENLKNIDVYYGEDNAKELFYNDSRQAGVWKDKSKSEIHSEPKVTYNERSIEEARKDIDALAQSLIEKYL